MVKKDFNGLTPSINDLITIMTTQRKKSKQKLDSNTSINTDKIRNQLDVKNEIQVNESDIYSNQSKQHKNNEMLLTAATPRVKRKGPVITSTKQMAFTVYGIENEISLAKKDWPCFALKELSYNAYDWLNDYYPLTVINENSVAIVALTVEQGDVSL